MTGHIKEIRVEDWPNGTRLVGFECAICGNKSGYLSTLIHKSECTMSLQPQTNKE